MTLSTKLLQALSLARAEFGPLVKNKENPHYHSRYADLSAVLDAVDEPLRTHGLMLLQSSEQVGETWVLRSTLVLLETGDTLESTHPLLVAKANDPQAMGSAVTYARRYAACALLGLAPEDDDGNAAKEPAQPARPATPAPSLSARVGLPASQAAPGQGQQAQASQPRPAAPVNVQASTGGRSLPDWTRNLIGGPMGPKFRPVMDDGRGIHQITWAEAIAGSPGGRREVGLQWLADPSGGGQQREIKFPQSNLGQTMTRENQMRAVRMRGAIAALHLKGISPPAAAVAAQPEPVQWTQQSPDADPPQNLAADDDVPAYPWDTEPNQ